MFHLKNLLSEYTMHWQKIKSWTFENGVYFFATITTYYNLDRHQTACVSLNVYDLISSQTT